MRTPEREPDSGFTLVELLLSVTILIVVLGSVSGALVVFLNNGAESLDRDAQSGGAALISSYLDRDVASAEDVAVGGTACSGQSNLATFTWRDYDVVGPAQTLTTTVTYVSAYAITEDPEATKPGDMRYQFNRTICVNGNPDKATLLSDVLPADRPTFALIPVSASTCRSLHSALLTVPVFSTDSGGPYTFNACTRTRLT